MAPKPKGPNPQPWQREVSQTQPPRSTPKPAPPTPLRPSTPPSVNAQLAKFGEQGEIGLQPQHPTTPTDPKQFQIFLNQMGKTHFGDKWVTLKEDGKVGPKTLAAARQLGVEVPPHLVPQDQQPQETQAQTPQQQAGQQGEAQPEGQDVGSSLGSASEPPAYDPDQWLRDNMGDVEPYLNIPELRDLIIRASQQRYSPERFEGELRASDWWKRNSDAEREWIVLESSQPGEAAKQIEDQKKLVTELARAEGLLLDDATIADLAARSKRGKWDNFMITAQLRDRPEWKGVSKSERDWGLLVHTNLGEANRQRVERTLEIEQLAAKLGVPISRGAAEGLAENSLKFDWSDATLKQNLVQGLNEGNTQGASLTSETDLRAKAKDWGFSPGNSEITKWVQNIAMGAVTIQDYEAELQGRAVNLWGSNAGLVEAMSRGISPRAFFQPYAQIIERELGTPSAQLDWQDPKYLVAMNYVDPKTNTRRPMNVDEWQQQIRGNDSYGWRYSKTANDLVDDVEHTILRMFGKVS